MRTSYSFLLAAGLVAVALPSTASAQWTLTWGGDTPACYNAGNGPMCMTAKLEYSANGSAAFYFWNRDDDTGVSPRGIVDNIGFTGLTAPTVTTFTLTGPGGTDSNWSYGTPPLGNIGNWGWGTSGGGICDKTDGVSDCGGPTSKQINTVWGGSFGDGGAAIFSFMLAPNLALPTGAVSLFAHVRDAVPQGDSWTSDRFVCADDRTSTCIEDDTPGTPQETVPEPATMTLLATGLAGLAAASRRRKRSNA